MSAERFIYWASGSPPCWRVLIALEEKGLEYDSRFREFSKKDHKSEEVLALNPRGQFPTFKDGESVVNDSGAAVLYLDSKYPDPPLFPADAASKATVFQRYFEAVALHENMRAYLRPKMMNKPDPEETEHKELLTKEFELWDSCLAKTKYVATDEFTAADVMFIPSVVFLDRLKFSFKNHPNLKRYFDMVKDRPSVDKTKPPHWKESEGPDIFSSF